MDDEFWSTIFNELKALPPDQRVLRLFGYPSRTQDDLRAMFNREAEQERAKLAAAPPAGQA